MIEKSSGLPQYSLRQSSEIFREMFDNARVAFGLRSNFRKSWKKFEKRLDMFGKSTKKTPSSVCLYN